MSLEKVILIKPQSFMNKSGLPIADIARFHKIDPSNVFVFHDELDLAAGKVRVKVGGGHGGHNGLRDIDRHLGLAYWRVRIGIGRPRLMKPWTSKHGCLLILIVMNNPAGYPICSML